jgi:Sulfotransferase family
VVEDSRRPLHVLHVGKTGGTSLNHILVEHAGSARLRLIFGGHQLRVADVPVGELFMFVLRDPLTRFVSAFNSRLREGRPRYHYPWREEERLAFAEFKTPDQLATALSSRDARERARARQAMTAIGHVNTHYTYWFGKESAFRKRLGDVFFIGFQEQLDDDFELLRTKLGLPAGLQLPRDATVAHRSPPGFAVELSEVAQTNLSRWYKDDLAFVELCRRLAPGVNATSGL